ncbi:MAG TPA: zf-HC2 domain-containing protein [Acidimicrobiia bacterium]|nr:zf-HC2 domain-containing protein [Acidimicrobiia bacterium]
MNARPAPDDRLSAYLDGELDAAERADVDGYLAESPEWRAERDAVAYARDALRGLSVHEAPPGFWEGVLSPELTRARTRRRSRLPRLVAAATAGVAVAAVVIASLVIPSPDRVTPRVPALSDSHAVRTSVSDEPVSQLAALSMITPFRR